MDVHTTANSRLFITRPRGLRKRGHRSCRRKTLPPKSTSQSSCIRRTTKTLSARRDNVDLADRSREMFENLLERSSSYSKRALDYWETSDEKMAVMAFVLIGCVFLSALNATLGALEDMPLTGVLLKIIGLYVTGYTIFRLVSHETDRREFFSIINEFFKKVVGADNAN